MCVSERRGRGWGGDGGEGERVGWCKGFLLSLALGSLARVKFLWTPVVLPSSCTTLINCSMSGFLSRSQETSEQEPCFHQPHCLFP